MGAQIARNIKCFWFVGDNFGKCLILVVRQFLLLPAAVPLWLVGWSLHWIGSVRKGAAPEKVWVSSEASLVILDLEENFALQNVLLGYFGLGLVFFG